MMHDQLFQSRRQRNRANRAQLRRRNYWHYAAYTGSIGNTANTQVNAASDDILRIDNTNGFMMPFDVSLLFAYGVGAQMLRAYLSSPKILQTNPLYLNAPNQSATPLSNGRANWWGPNYLTLRGQEDLLAYVTNSAAGPTRTNIFIAVTDNLQPIPAGQIYTVYATSTTAATANAWSTIAYTMASALPAGQYALVGSYVSSTTNLGHRWILPNQFFRPGFPSAVNTWDMPIDIVRHRTLGLMGMFYQYNLPQLQVFCTAADAAYDIFMDLIKVG